MKRTQFQALFTSLLLIAFLADETNLLTPYAPHRLSLLAVDAKTETTIPSAHDEHVKRPPLKHHIKFTDIDSSLLQVPCDSDIFCETLTYAVSNHSQDTDAPLKLVSLHKLCILLI